MPNTFQCPKCGASYARERRRIGKAVVCSCGHKFLVPPAAGDEPPVRPYSAPPHATPRGRASPKPPRKQPQAGSDSSAEVLPLAEVIQPTGPPPAGRWAAPIEPLEAEPVPQAEVVYPAAAYAEPVPAADDLFSAGGAYGNPVGAGAYAAPLAAPPPPRADGRRKKKSGSAGDGGQMGFSNWVAYVVLFLLLPAAGIFTLLGVVEHRRSGPAGGPQRAANPPPPTSLPAPSAPPAASLSVVILRATKKATSDDFSMEYEVGHQPLNPASQYIWVVSSPQGRIEFQIPTPAQGRGQISGKPAQPAGLNPPFTTHIEEQSNAARTRVSNEVNVTVDGTAESAKAGNSGPFSADGSLVGSLAPEVTVGPYRLRLPNGMQAQPSIKDTTLFGVRGQSWSWLGAADKRGRSDTIMISVVDKGRLPNDLDRTLDAYKQELSDAARGMGTILGHSGSPTKGVMMGKPFIRSEFQIIYGIKNVQFCIAFLGYDGNKLVVLQFACCKPEGTQDYKVLETSLLSIR